MIIGAILLFQLALTLNSAWQMYGDGIKDWDVYHYDPIAKLLFTLFWTGIFFRKRFFFLLYISLTMLELCVRVFFGTTEFGKEFGAVFFPADILFAFVILFLYKQYFGERSASKELPS